MKTMWVIKDASGKLHVVENHGSPDHAGEVMGKAPDGLTTDDGDILEIVDGVPVIDAALHAAKVESLATGEASYQAELGLIKDAKDRLDALDLSETPGSHWPILKDLITVLRHKS